MPRKRSDADGRIWTTAQEREGTMPKVVFIGAGSFGFTRNLVRDLLTFDLLRNAEMAIGERAADFILET